jgi:hypothetical protein
MILPFILLSTAGQEYFKIIKLAKKNQHNLSEIFFMKNKFIQLSISVLISAASVSSNAQSWSLTGNRGTNVSTNFIGTKDSKALVLRTNNIERMRINSNGKIGIGTTTPDASLSIANSSLTSLSSPGAFIIGTQAATNLAFDYHQVQARFNGQGGTLFLNQLAGPVWLGNNGSGFPALWTNADGKVGIGTNYALASGYALTVEPLNFGNGIYINDPGNGYSLYTVKTGNYGAAVHVQAPYTYTAAIEAFTHDAQRAIYGEDSLNGNGVEGHSYGGYAVVGVSAVNVGVLGIAPSYAGYFDGDVYASGIYSSSDEKLKHNIIDFSGAMEIIDQLHPKHYEYRHDGNYKLMNLPTGDHYGLIAQDVEKILPDMVKDTKFETRLAMSHTANEEIKNAEAINFKALNYTELIPVIIKGMQELEESNNTEVAELGSEIADLKSQIECIKATLNTHQSGINNSSACLFQNIPNPFSKNTVIKCYIPASSNKAQLEVYGVNGKLLKTFSLNNSRANEITIDANTLSSGEYIYSLVIDGKKIDSKNMVLTRQ